MFVDASAIIAILTRETDADALADVLEGAGAPITSPIAIFEAVHRGVSLLFKGEDFVRTDILLRRHINR